MLVIYLALAAAGVVWASLRGQPNVWRYPGIPSDAVHVGWGIVGGLTIATLFVIFSRLSVLRFAWARELHRDFRERLGPLGDEEIVVLAGASSVGEEVFFRGALAPAIGVWLSSLVFAALHVGPRKRHLPWTVSSFVAGLLFALLFRASGDLTGPVLGHFLVNFLNLRHLRDRDLR